MAKKGWIMLKNLRPGAVFQFEDGTKAFNPVGGPTYRLDTGEAYYPPKANRELVSEIVINPLGYYWVGILIGMARAAKLSDEDKTKLDTLTKQLLDRFGM